MRVSKQAQAILLALETRREIALAQYRRDKGSPLAAVSLAQVSETARCIATAEMALQIIGVTP